jgi:hypothetical protein
MMTFCSAAQCLGSFRMRPFRFKLRQGTTPVPYLRTSATSRNDGNSLMLSTRNLRLPGSQIRVDKGYVPVRE